MKPGDLVKLHSSVNYVYIHDFNGIPFPEPLRKTEGITMLILENETRIPHFLGGKLKVLTSDGRTFYIKEHHLEVLG